MEYDHLELLMELEDIFDMRIPDKEMRALRTLGQFRKAVLSRVHASATTHRCVTQRAFYRLRGILADLAHRDPAQIRPDTPTEELIPRQNRRGQWKELGRQTGLDIPPLRARARVLIIGAGAVLIPSILLFTVLPSLRDLIWILVLPGGICAIAIGVFLEDRCGSIIPDSCATVGGLAKTVKTYNLAKISGGRFTEKDVLETISTLMARGYDVEYDDVDLPPETKLRTLELAIAKRRRKRSRAVRGKGQDA